MPATKGYRLDRLRRRRRTKAELWQAWVLYALAGATGAKKWEFMTGGTLASPSIGMKGTVYVASGDNGIYALDGATGSNIWTFVIETPEGVNYPPDSLAIGVDNTVYFVQSLF